MPGDAVFFTDIRICVAHFAPGQRTCAPMRRPMGENGWRHDSASETSCHIGPDYNPDAKTQSRLPDNVCVWPDSLGPGAWLTVRSAVQCCWNIARGKQGQGSTKRVEGAIIRSVVRQPVLVPNQLLGTICQPSCRNCEGQQAATNSQLPSAHVTLHCFVDAVQDSRSISWHLKRQQRLCIVFLLPCIILP